MATWRHKETSAKTGCGCNVNARDWGGWQRSQMGQRCQWGSASKEVRYSNKDLQRAQSSTPQTEVWPRPGPESAQSHLTNGPAEGPERMGSVWKLSHTLQKTQRKLLNSKGTKVKLCTNSNLTFCFFEGFKWKVKHDNLAHWKPYVYVWSTWHFL